MTIKSTEDTIKIMNSYFAEFKKTAMYKNRVNEINEGVFIPEKYSLLYEQVNGLKFELEKLDYHFCCDDFIKQSVKTYMVFDIDYSCLDRILNLDLSSVEIDRSDDVFFETLFEDIFYTWLQKEKSVNIDCVGCLSKSISKLKFLGECKS